MIGEKLPEIKDGIGYFLRQLTDFYRRLKWQRNLVSR